MVNKINSWVLFCVFIGVAGVLALGSSGSFAAVIGCPDPAQFPLNGCSLPGVADGNFPYVDQQASVSYKDKNTTDDNFKIKAKTAKGKDAGLLQIDQATTIDLSKMKVKFSANVQGASASGSVKLSGNLPNSESLKVTADLEGAWSASQDGTLWGFNLNNMSCSGATEVNCGSDGVIYLNLADPIGPATGERKITTTGEALTSLAAIPVSEVPLPATAWLFGSGLLGLVAISRRRLNRIRA